MLADARLLTVLTVPASISKVATFVVVIKEPTRTTVQYVQNVNRGQQKREVISKSEIA